MSALDAEKKAHERTKKRLVAAELQIETIMASWRRETAELVEARTELDRARVERTRLEGELKERDEEAEALRNQIAMLARAAGGGAVL